MSVQFGADLAVGWNEVKKGETTTNGGLNRGHFTGKRSSQPSEPMIPAIT